MGTRAGFKGGAKKTVAAKPTPQPKKTEDGKKPRVRVDPLAQLSRVIAGVTDEDAEDNGPKVMANVPHDFKLTDDRHVIHAYAKGAQMMPKSHAEHFYAVANGVKIVEE